MEKVGCEVCAVLPENDPLLETHHWMATLSPDQGYLGRTYVTLKEHKSSLSELSDDEWLEYSHIVKKLEKGIATAFGAELFNWGCLMNNAFAEYPPKPHVHWHLRPRYRSTVKIAGEEFEDPLFGYHYDRSQIQKVSAFVLGSIKDEITSALN